MNQTTIESLREEVRTAWLEAAVSPGARVAKVLAVMGLDLGEADELDALFAAHYRDRSPPHTLELKDCHGVALREGDTVIGMRGYVKSDGYLPKSAPQQVRAVFRIEWSAGAARYALRHLGFHPDDQAHVDARQYRIHHHTFEASMGTFEREGIHYSTGKHRADLVCQNVERYEGPIAFLPQPMR